MGKKRKIFPSYGNALITLDRFALNRVNSCNKSFWAQNLYYLKSIRTFFISKKPLSLLQAQKEDWKG